MDDGAKAGDAKGAADPTRVPQMGVDDLRAPALAPTPEDLMTPPGQPLPAPDSVAAEPPGGQGTVIPLPTNRALPPNLRGQRHRPPESDQQRANMPKPASVHVRVGQDATGADTYEDFEGGLVAGPRHIGMRQTLDPDVPLDEQMQ
jgi:hypothetical protein